MSNYHFPRQFTLVSEWEDQPVHDPLADLLDMEPRCANWCVPELIGHTDGAALFPYNGEIQTTEIDKAKVWASRLVLDASAGTREIRSWTPIHPAGAPERFQATVFQVVHYVVCDMEDGSNATIKCVDDRDVTQQLEKIAAGTGLIFVKHSPGQTPGRYSTAGDDVFIPAAKVQRVTVQRRKTELPTY